MGSTPNGLSISPDGGKLLIANADNNTITIVDVSKPGWSRSRVACRPAGIRPACCSIATGAGCSSSTARGCRRRPNRADRSRAVRASMGSTPATCSRARISTVPLPNDAALARYSHAGARAHAVHGRTSARAARMRRAASPIPRRVGDSSPIKHVFYVIRENRTYDQVLGDLPKGNGDPVADAVRRRGDPQRPRARARPSRPSTTSTSTPK